MNGILKSLAFLGISILFIAKLPAQGVTSQDVIHCKASELDVHPIKTEGFLFTISRFKNGSFKLSISNSSESLSAFFPESFAVIGSDGNQRYVAESFIDLSLRWVLPTQIKIAPQAHIDLTYRLNDDVKFPARIVYEGKTIASITK
jgi:hypothetical protein